MRDEKHVLESRYLLLFALAMLGLFSSCATLGQRVPEASLFADAPTVDTHITDTYDSYALSPDAAEALRRVEEEILETDRDLETEAMQDSRKDRSGKIPIEINERVRKWIHYFTVKDRERFQRFLNRGAVYRSLIQELLAKNGVPTDLYYLAMIESGFTLHAKSHAGAVGAWQFIPGTGRRYGLTRNRYVDERLEIIRSTEAAAKYLKNLHIAFQSWYLAMASYNAGEGRILGAVLRGGTRDFWELVERRSLPPETRNYVPKFLAAAIIGKHPEKYGFHIPEVEPYPAVEMASVPGGVRLTTIAKLSGIPLPILKRLNPHFYRGITPPGRKDYVLWVPEGGAEKIDARKLALAKTALAKTALAKPVRKKRFYRVKRGDALAQIARRHNISVSQLKRLNALKSSRIWAGQKLRIAISQN